jgi:hypothetical protein
MMPTNTYEKKKVYIKTLVSPTKEGIDQQVNDFKEDNDVQFLQTNVTISHEGVVRYHYVAFYTKTATTR